MADGIIIDDFFQSAMQDFTGRTRLESEDPRWSHLLRASASLRILCGDEGEVTSFMLRLVRHNPDTGNLLLLLEHTVSRMRQIRLIKKKPAPITTSQCCMALRLSRFVFNFLCAHLPPSEIRRQLGLSMSWPSNMPTFSADNTPTPYARPSDISEGDTIVHSLLQELLQLCCQNPLMAWNTEVLFETLNLLITLCSTGLYDTCSNPTTSTFTEGDANMFMEYIFMEASRQHTDRLSRGANDFEVTGSRMVGSLLKIIVDKPSPEADSCSSGVLGMYGARTHKLPETVRAKYTYNSPVSNIVAALPSVGELRIFQQTLWSGITMASAYLAIPFSWDRIYTFIVSTAARARLNFSNTSSILPTHTNTNTTPDAPIPTSASSHHTTPQHTPLRRTSSAGSVTSLNLQLLSINSNPNLNPNRNPTARQIYGRVSDSPVAQRCSLFLLILLHNKRHMHTHNPFREALSTITDENRTQTSSDIDTNNLADGPTPNVLSQIPSVVMNVPKLVRSLTDDIDLESHSLLLYTALQSNPELLSYMIMSDAADTQTHIHTDPPPLLDVLRCLYEAPLRTNPGLAGGPKHIYTLMIHVLMCTHDEANLQHAFRNSKIDYVAWYREKILREVSIGSVCVLCVLRTLTHALHTEHDSYLISNTLAVLQNLGPHVEFLHPYAAQRLVFVCWKLARRVIAMITGVSPAVSLKEVIKKSDAEADRQTDTHSQVEALANQKTEAKDQPRVETAEVQSFVAALQDVCEVIAHTLSPNKMLSNAHVVYHLVHQYREVSVYLAHAEVRSRVPLSETILDVTHMYYRLLREHDTAQVLVGPDTAIEALKTHIQTNSQNMAYEVPESITLAYFEVADPEKYFVPYVWEVIYTHTPDIGWYTHHIRLFDALADAFAEDEPDDQEALAYTDAPADMRV